MNYEEKAQNKFEALDSKGMWQGLRSMAGTIKKPIDIKVGKGKETSDLLFTQDNTIKEEALSALLALGFTKKVAYKKMEQVTKNNEGEITVEDLVRRSLG